MTLTSTDLGHIVIVTTWCSKYIKQRKCEFNGIRTKFFGMPFDQVFGHIFQKFWYQWIREALFYGIGWRVKIEKKFEKFLDDPLFALPCNIFDYEYLTTIA